jgi:hypothetical protein
MAEDEPSLPEPSGDSNKRKASSSAASKTDKDNFVASMSFARMPQRGTFTPPDWDTFDIFGGASVKCDCDECGISEIPLTIQRAIGEHKRRKRATGPLTRTQHRKLVKRATLSNNLSVWHWTLPFHAEPLLEFGNSHRLVWIQRLPGRLYTIGDGIVGSEAEEAMRQALPWEEGEAYFVPSKGGKAVGWVHYPPTTDEKDARGKALTGPAEVWIAKLPSNSLESYRQQRPEETDSGNQTERIQNDWSTSLLRLTDQYVRQPLPPLDSRFIALSRADKELLQKVIGAA